MFIQKLIVHSGDGLFGVEDRRKIEGDSDVDVSRGGCIFSDVFEE